MNVGLAVTGLLGRAAVSKLWGLGRAFRLLVLALLHWPSGWRSLRWGIRQMHASGVLSVSIIFLSATFLGMVLGLQGYTILSRFGASPALGQLIALAIVRELGPVFSGLLFAGRAGSALTAEIGLMKATDQLSSLEMIGVDPMQRVLAPRLWAGLLSLPILTLLFNTTAIVSGYLVGVQWLGVDEGAFWSNMQTSVNFHEDILNGSIKSIVFGLFISWIALFHGLDARPNAEGVSQATTRSVVHSSIVILALDFFLTAIMFTGDL